MKKLLFALLTILFMSSTAFAEWKPDQSPGWFMITSQLAALEPSPLAGNQGLRLSLSPDINTGLLMVVVVDKTEGTCDFLDVDMHYPSPIKINGRFVKIMSACYNTHLRVTKPLTLEGQAYLLQLVISKKVGVRIEQGQVETFFPAADPSNVISEIKKSQTAM